MQVTRRFESQNERLGLSDLEAAAAAIRLYPAGGALAFYNCGDFSGRSQPHKHLQVVPLPLDESLAEEPFLRTIREAHKSMARQQQEGAPGKHRLGTWPGHRGTLLWLRRGGKRPAAALLVSGLAAAVTELSALPFRAYGAALPPGLLESGQGPAALLRLLDEMVDRVDACPMYKEPEVGPR